MKRYPSADPCRPGPPPGCCPPPGCFPPPGCCPPRCRGQQGGYPVPALYVPGGTYYAGQVVLYNDDIYVVNENDPQGLPGSSDGYTRIASDPGGQGEVRQGPTGPTGPAGPAGGAPGATGPTEAGRVRHGEEKV